MGSSGFAIGYSKMRLDKPLSEIMPDDVPRGFDPEDVCAVDEHGELILTRQELAEYHSRQQKR